VRPLGAAAATSTRRTVSLGTGAKKLHRLRKLDLVLQSSLRHDVKDDTCGKSDEVGDVVGLVHKLKVNRVHEHHQLLNLVSCKGGKDHRLLAPRVLAPGLAELAPQGRELSALDNLNNRGAAPGLAGALDIASAQDSARAHTHAKLLLNGSGSSAAEVLTLLASLTHTSVPVGQDGSAVPVKDKLVPAADLASLVVASADDPHVLRHRAHHGANHLSIEGRGARKERGVNLLHPRGGSVDSGSRNVSHSRSHVVYRKKLFRETNLNLCISWRKEH